MQWSRLVATQRFGITALFLKSGIPSCVRGSVSESPRSLCIEKTGGKTLKNQGWGAAVFKKPPHNSNASELHLLTQTTSVSLFQPLFTTTWWDGWTLELFNDSAYLWSMRPAQEWVQVKLMQNSPSYVRAAVLLFTTVNPHLFQYESNPQKYRTACVWNHLVHSQLFATLWTIAHQAPLSMGFFRQEYLSRLPCPPPGNFPDPGIEPACLRSPAPTGRFFTTSTTWEVWILLYWVSYWQVYCLPPRRNCHKGPILFVFLVVAHRIFLCILKNWSIVDLKCFRCTE